jgi:hypothetical protein
MAELAQAADGLQPAEDLLDKFPGAPFGRSESMVEPSHRRGSTAMKGMRFFVAFIPP